MKSIITKKTYASIYRLLGRVSPIAEDCGQLCGNACCTCGGGGSSESSSDFEMGMYLLPGEEKLFTRKENWLRWNIEQAEDYEFPDSWHGKIYFIRCTTAPLCPREKRPLQCRTFPLAPHITENGELQLILFPGELPYDCPLISRRIPLKNDFIRVTYTAWKHLIKEPLIYDLVFMDSRNQTGELVIVYPK